MALHFEHYPVFDTLLTAVPKLYSNYFLAHNFMKHFLIISILALFIVSVMSSCAPQIYQAADFSTYKAKHKVVAILPFNAQIKVKRLPKGVTAESIKESEKEIGYSMQDNLYNELFRQLEENHYTIDLQDTSQTNTLLEGASIKYADIQSKQKTELCRILGVDAVISGDITLSKPISDGGAVAMGLLLDVWGSTNQIKVSMNIHEGENSKLLWKYNYMASGGVGSSTENIAIYLARNASRKFPYKRDK